jgi:tetratricopeptide (TPR) repeat protein
MDFEELLRLGTRLLQLGEAGQARPYLEQAYTLNPQHINAALNLGGACILLGRFKQAIPILERASALQPDNAMIWVNLGAAYLGNPILATDRQQLQAMKAFKRALEIQPDAPSVAYNLGLIYRDRGAKDEALHWFREAVRVNSRDQDAQRYLDRLARESG